MVKPRVEPRQQRSRDTYDRILDIAAQVFTDRGYAETTTNKVAEAAGISIGTFYHYFQSKDALLYALAERHHSESTALIGGAFRRLRALSPDLRDSLRIVLDVVVSMHVDGFNLHHLLYSSAPRSPLLQQRMYDVDGMIADEIVWHLDRLGLASENRLLVAQMLVVAVEAQVHRAIIDATLLGDDPADPEMLAEMLTDLWHRALEGS